MLQQVSTRVVLQARLRCARSSLRSTDAPIESCWKRAQSRVDGSARSRAWNYRSVSGSRHSMRAARFGRHRSTGTRQYRIPGTEEHSACLRLQAWSPVLPAVLFGHGMTTAQLGFRIHTHIAIHAGHATFPSYMVDSTRYQPHSHHTMSATLTTLRKTLVCKAGARSKGE